MATATANLVHDSSTLANLQSWAQFIFDGFNTTAGWTQTSDTGQTAPSSASSLTTSYYFLFRMADGLQTSCPVFVKITYGASATSVQFTISVGQGSDGAGSLTGAVSDVPGNGLTTNQGVATFPCYVSGDSGSIRFMMWQSNTANTCRVFGIERSKNSSGSNTGDYVTFINADANANNTNNWKFQQLVSGN